MNAQGYAQGQAFTILNEKVLPAPARLLSWCPTMDIIAFVADTSTVSVHRMSGQRVWTQDVNVRVECIAWKPDGKLLAIGLDNGATLLCDVNDGSVAHKIDASYAFGKVCMVGWVQEDPTQRQRKFRRPDGQDIEKFMPRLNKITSTSKAGAHSVLDAIVQSADEAVMDVLIAADDQGHLHVSIFGTFFLGTVTLPVPAPAHHSSTSTLSTHIITVADKGVQNRQWSLLDMSFFRHYNVSIRNLASISTKVFSLIAYLAEAFEAMTAEWKEMKRIQQLYMEACVETIEEHGAGPVTPVIELFQLLMTGIPSSVLREWLTDRLTERGLKRWEKASVSGYAAIRRLVVEHVHPALDRLALALTKLEKLSSDQSLDLHRQHVQRCLDLHRMLFMQSHFLLRIMNEEDVRFKSFAAWLRFIFDEISPVEGAPPPNDDAPDEIDATKVAEFIVRCLPQSRIRPYFENEGPALPRQQRPEEASDIKMSKTFMNDWSIQQIEGDAVSDEASLENILKTLRLSSIEVFRAPAQMLREKISIHPQKLLATGNPEGRSTSSILRVVERVNEKEVFMAYDVTHGSERALHVHRYLIREESGSDANPCSTLLVGIAVVNLEANGEPCEVKDLAFVDDQSMLLLLCTSDSSKYVLWALDYSSLTYSPLAEGSVITTDIPSQPLQTSRKHWFDAAFVPRAIAVNGRAGRRIGCVMAEEQQRYLIFDLDADDESEDGTAHTDEEEIDMEE
ncbi:hypothetical protein SAICODRAFT_70201 [Saitoella complicata NRRL Y-17804]|uniref:Anaphase-promoting complex subunit 4 n=1 Tax=Saitoella complicata (strain BCRC 22490 / CBS 7301 / JCM 7358 / NBRC 10748 / NRRL Y-17804) TaxID=698492 RepID=A0A0E9NJS9_SAICN|nr:uncharacterized protein SAICODRAFT_70201 [Saitoella complicata NRRL Y-17804]ODQ54492.1 hypothetical protein SAICODRAFT_70201 [Saitoella complicata NRRL Y-17804]GAO50137.1 hypothetical protein G7K_4272-t1 [Saitoella complicata NRRL Y-17804]